MLERSDTTVYASQQNISATSGPSAWLQLDVDSFNGSTVGERVAQAAASINADILSPSGLAYNGNLTLLDPTFPGYETFTTEAMVDTAHALGLSVKVWTVNRLNTVDQLYGWGVDGIITDYVSLPFALVARAH
jgi:glycerophosphoryl diester phosphodiesterase